MTEEIPLIPKWGATDPNIDRGWAWMVLLGGSLCHLIFIGLQTALGIYYVEIQSILNVSIVDVSIIGALSNFSIFTGVVITSPLTKKFGCRMLAIIGSLAACFSYFICSFWMTLYTLYIFLGVLQGLGVGLTFSSSVMAINRYFNRGRSMGLVVVNAAGGIGIITFSPFMSFLLQIYSVKGVFLINAGISLQMTIGAMLYFPQSQRNAISKSDDSCKGQTVFGIFSVYLDKALWKNPLHYMTSTSSFLYGMGTYIPFTLLPDYMVTQGIAMNTAALSISIIGVTTTIGRLILSWISYTFPWSNRWFYILSGIISGILLFIVPSCRTEAHYLALSAVYGLSHGIVGTLMPALLVELFGSTRLPECFGLNNLVIGLGSLVGSPLAGFIAEMVPFVGIEFIVGGLAFIFCGLVMLPTICNVSRCRLSDTTEVLKPKYKYIK